MNDNQLIRPEAERFENLTWENATPSLQDRGREIMREARFAGNTVGLNEAVRQAAAESETNVRQSWNGPQLHEHVVIVGASHTPAEIAAHEIALKTVQAIQPAHEMTWADLHPRVETERSNKPAAASNKQEHGFGNSI